MPAVYAHRRFGEKVLAACQNDVARTAIESYLDLYNIGLQGPDILFYYDPLRKNAYKAAGDAMHNAPAAPFFQAGAAHVNGRPEGQALLSYLLGFLCHFALDSECHSYIEYEIGRSVVHGVAGGFVGVFAQGVVIKQDVRPLQADVVQVGIAFDGGAGHVVLTGGQHLFAKAAVCIDSRHKHSPQFIRSQAVTLRFCVPRGRRGGRRKSPAKSAAR